MPLVPGPHEAWDLFGFGKLSCPPFVTFQVFCVISVVVDIQFTTINLSGNCCETFKVSLQEFTEHYLSRY